MRLLLSMFAYPFIVRAFLVGILVSLCASLLGVPLVLFFCRKTAAEERSVCGRS